MGTFLGDREEAGGVGLRWAFATKDEPDPAGMEGAAVRPPGADAPPEGYVVSFVAFHERGLRVPPSHFMRALFHYYKVELHHLAPNSISQAAIFAAVCEEYLGMEPH
jgi:hypothetical protein